MPQVICLSIVLMLSVSFVADATELVSTLEDQTSVAVTIYNKDLALVRDARRVTLAEGRQTLALREVSGRIRPETALLAAPGLKVLEQNFEYDLLTPNALLAKYVGQQVTLVKTHPATGEEVLTPAKVLSAASGVVLQVGDHIESGVPGRLIYPDVPADLRDRPTLTMLVESRDSQPQPVVLSYLTRGLSWHADYVAELNDADTAVDLSGWVTLNNESGATYRNAQLKLVAGEVHQVQQQFQPMRLQRKMAITDSMDAGNMAEESMFEYHLYSLGRPTTIREKQSKQVALLQADRVKVRKELVFQGQNYYYSGSAGVLGKKLKAGVFVQLKNSRAAGLGMPLPAGVMRVYKKDRSGNLQFVGEDSIDHTPENETIRLKLGEAFDVTADKKQTDFKKLAGNSIYHYVYEAAFQFVLKNGKDDAVTVRVVEPVPGDWKIVKESAPHVKESSGTAVWKVEIPAKGNTELTYRVQVKY
jgi:hypothetical protein